MPNVGLSQTEPGQFDEFHATGEGLGDAADEVRRGAAEDQEARVGIWTVDQNPEDVEQVGRALDLVQDDEAGKRTQHHLGIGEAAQVYLGFEIEAGRLACFGEGAGQRRLAALARSQQGGDRRTARGAG